MSISDVTMKLNMDRYLLLALEEDITSEDVSANAVMDQPCLGEVELICKQSGVLAGLQVFSRVFELLDERFTMESFCADGDRVEPGQRLALLRGDIRALLSGERTALNFLQRMSGIATHTAELVSLLQGSGITLLDTRKTTPNLRIFEKYAVTVGGGLFGIPGMLIAVPITSICYTLLGQKTHRRLAVRGIREEELEAPPK